MPRCPYEQLNCRPTCRVSAARPPRAGVTSAVTVSCDYTRAMRRETVERPDLGFSLGRPMAVELPARGVRVGGVSVAPGEARAVRIPARAGARARGAGAGSAAVPAWVIVGSKPGPRISVVAAVRGVEATAARAATRLAASLDPGALAGSVVVVPVLRAGGRLAPRRVAGRPAAVSRRRGRQPGGARRLRPLLGRRGRGAGAHRARGAAAWPARRRRRPRTPRRSRGSVGWRCGAARPRCCRRRWRRADLLAAAAAVQVVAVELTAAGAASPTPAPPSRWCRGARALLAALGVLAAARRPVAAPDGGAGAGRRPRVRRARCGCARRPTGSSRRRSRRGALVRARGAARARRAGAARDRPRPSSRRAAGLVIEAAHAGPVRAGATLFALVPVAGVAGVARRRGERARRPTVAPRSTARRGSAGSSTWRCRGWRSRGSRPRSTPARAPRRCT